MTKEQERIKQELTKQKQALPPELRGMMQAVIDANLTPRQLSDLAAAFRQEIGRGA